MIRKASQGIEIGTGSAHIDRTLTRYGQKIGSVEALRSLAQRYYLEPGVDLGALCCALAAAELARVDTPTEVPNMSARSALPLTPNMARTWVGSGDCIAVAGEIG